MIAFLASSYSAYLSKKEQAEIDQQVKKNRKEFYRGFEKGIKISISVYSIYALARATAAYTSDSCPDLRNIVTAGPENNGSVQPSLQAKPGYKPLNKGIRGTFVGGTSAICGAALQSGDFYLGVACAFLSVLEGIVINRPYPQNSY